MATLVLTAVGTAIGGPIGGAIGGLIGNVLDHAVIFKPKGREGPRLNELHVQMSTYGAQVPKLFGTMRVAGTVIWATDLKETSSRSGGGKGRPSVTTFNYSCSFAVALSARKIRSVGRIWADGNLLRGAAGDFKTEVGAFRVHDGGADQAVDPLIAAAVGMGQASAHRGMAYALFEDLALADYGNRIPSLTFEVEADDGAVAIAAIAGGLSDGVLAGEDLGSVRGYAAAGRDVGEAMGPLIEAYGLAVVADDAGLRLVAAADEAAAEIGADMLCAQVNGRALGGRSRVDAAADGVPVGFGLRHYDPARDYQAGVQRVSRPGPGRSEGGIELPAVLSGEEALALAARRLRVEWAGRARMVLHGDWTMLDHAPGAVVRVAGAGGLWRVEEREWEEMAVRVALRRVPGGGAALPDGAAPGAIVREVDAPHGATSLMLVDLPRLADGAAIRPAIMAAASGGAGWRRAALFAMSADGEASPIGRTAPRATMGVLAEDLGAGSATLLDEAHVAVVTLLADDMELGPASEAMLAQGRNLCLIGHELAQFAQAQRIDAATFRLTGLRRGIGGTEWAMAHDAGEPFLLVETERLVDVLAATGGGEAGGTMRLAAIGIGDTEPAEADLVVTGEALIPPCPVYVNVQAVDGGWAFSWVRRSRAGWQWRSGGDVPLAEESEGYTLELRAGDALVRRVETVAPEWTYDAAMVATDGTAGAALTIDIRQIGSLAMGRAARISFTA